MDIILNFQNTLSLQIYTQITRKYSVINVWFLKFDLFAYIIKL